jgi:hypothetical protein
MASETDPIAPRTWVPIDIAKGVNVALLEHPDGKQQRFRFVHQRDDYDRLIDFLKSCVGPVASLWSRRQTITAPLPSG